MHQWVCPTQTHFWVIQLATYMANCVDLFSLTLTPISNVTPKLLLLSLVGTVPMCLVCSQTHNMYMSLRCHVLMNTDNTVCKGVFSVGREQPLSYRLGTITVSTGGGIAPTGASLPVHCADVCGWTSTVTENIAIQHGMKSHNLRIISSRYGKILPIMFAWLTLVQGTRNYFSPNKGAPGYIVYYSV